ncbi:uncharacterized protein [Rutidosis leptorrhynchoides]|uniref:uncharacterized protein n=1 Tax=Rutidosis leptorrhynchoides TaxID=125765 RepID=UPI003A993970
MVSGGLICIPRHAFIVWLLMTKKLKTQNKMFPWDVKDGSHGLLVCSSCKIHQDSHNHLFFECAISKELGMSVRGIRNKWKDIVDLLIPYAHRKVTRMVVIKINFAVAVYFIWQ